MTQTLPNTLDMISTLLATPSVSSVCQSLDMSNRSVIDQLATWLDSIGFKTIIQPIDGTEKANLIATLGSGPGGLVLAGHTDTVPYDDRGWSSDPFIASVREERLYGLGSVDMKSFLAMAISAAQHYQASQLVQPLIILATADEETTMSGARALSSLPFPKARYAVIGEPTSLRPVYMHKGVGMYTLTLHGKSGHSSNPELGKSALEGMHTAISTLLALRADWQQKNIMTEFTVPVPTLNLGHIHGGDNPNRICGQCQLSFDLRPLPGMKLNELAADIEIHLHRALKDSGLTFSLTSIFPGLDALKTDITSPIVRLATRLTGSEAEVVNFGTEAPFLNDLGIQTIVCGPGEISQAHQPNESLALARIPETVTLLRHFIENFCVTPQAMHN